MLRRSSVVTEQPFDYRPGRTKQSRVSGLIRALDGIQLFLGKPAALQDGQDELRFRLDIAFSFVAKSFRQGLLQGGISRRVSQVGPKIITNREVVLERKAILDTQIKVVGRLIPES